MDGIALLLVKLRKLLRARGRSHDDTDDLIQEAFLRLQVYCQDKPIEQAESFLVRTVLNLSVDDRRRPHHRVMTLSRMELLPLVDGRPLPEEVIATQQRLMQVKEALDVLSPRVREVFMLHRAEGYSYEQIAERLGISMSTVEKHMAKAALFFDSWLEKESQV